MKLMKGLSEDIHGKLAIESKEGTIIKVEIPVNLKPQHNESFYS